MKQPDSLDLQGRWPRRSLLKFLGAAGAGVVFSRALVSLAAAGCGDGRLNR